MTEQLYSGSHPDAEVLNAFIEGALPERERLECVSHFAQCARCREIVFLAQPPQPLAPVVPVKQPWSFQLRALAGAIAACVLVVAFLLYKRELPPKFHTLRDENQAPAPRTAVTAPLPAPVPAARTEAIPARRSAKAKAQMKVPPSRSVEVASAKAEPPTSLPPAVAGGVLGGIVGGSASPPAAQQNQPVSPSQAQSHATPQRQFSLNERNLAPAPAAPLARFAQSASSSEIKGSVSDPSGAAISGATVTIQALTGAAHGTTKTDSSGQFSIAGLAPGRYQVQIESPGFVRFSSQVELKANDIALLDSTLSVGSLAQTVEVTGVAPAIQAQTAGSETLSGKRPFIITVSSGERMLGVDAAGALYFSKNQGKHWKTVKPKWHGKVSRIMVLPDNPKSLFQLTTDSGAVWSSPDGTHWHPQKN